MLKWLDLVRPLLLLPLLLWVSMDLVQTCQPSRDCVGVRQQRFSAHPLWQDRQVLREGPGR